MKITKPMLSFKKIENPIPFTPERRGARRFQVSVPLLVEGTDSKGNRFYETTASINISNSGIYLTLTRPTLMNSPVRITIFQKQERSKTILTSRGRIVRRLGSKSVGLSGTFLISSNIAVEFDDPIRLRPIS